MGIGQVRVSAPEVEEENSRVDDARRPGCRNQTSGRNQEAGAPEAVYLRGVSRYKSSHSAAPLKEAYEKLRAEYPASEWTQRAQPYSLL